MKLYLDSGKHEITNEKGQVVSVGNAKAFWLAGDVGDCSQSFQRLANSDFDFDKMDDFYNTAD